MNLRDIWPKEKEIFNINNDNNNFAYTKTLSQG